MALTSTTADLAEAVLRELGVIDATESPEATDETYVINVAFGARFGIVPDSPENATAILRKWFTTVIDNARADVLAYEQQKAAKTASDAVQMITASVSGA